MTPPSVHEVPLPGEASPSPTSATGAGEGPDNVTAPLDDDRSLGELLNEADMVDV